MATVYSVQKTKWDQNVPSEKIDTTELAGRVRVAFAEYEAASLASGDVIQMFNLPNGARIVSGRLAHDALNSSTTLSVGYAAHTNAAGTAVSLSAAAYKAAGSSASATAANVANTIALGENSIVDANKDGLPVSVTLGGASADGTIQLTMMYVVD
nr:TonB-dependent receptor domain protein [uncultured Mediterranean phage uvMED]BAR37493.1 TonB-dependent receptor domain protein [uncultured Mediterranean phage uvMED]